MQKKCINLVVIFPTTKFIREEKLRVTVDEWLVSIAPPGLYRSEALSLMDACDNMAEILVGKGFVMPVMDSDDTIINDVQTESLLLQFQELILKNRSIKFSFNYWPKISDGDLLPWEGGFNYGRIPLG
jgi:hypothetical protein